MKIYPETAATQLEFEKVKIFLHEHARTEYGKHKAATLRIHTKKEYIDDALRQSHEFKMLLEQSTYFPNDFTLNIQREIKLLGIPGGMLTGEQFIFIRKLAENTERIFRWFDNERRSAYPALAKLIQHSHYEKQVSDAIDAVLDETGEVKDAASPELQKIRLGLFKKRNELRRAFEKVVARLNKAGYATEIEESFSNGRRVVAVFSEFKRVVKGIMHGESDSRRTTYIEPEETIELNSDVYHLEGEERKEVIRILRALTAALSGFSGLIAEWFYLSGEFDFARAKGMLALDMNGHFPNVHDKALVDLKEAYHPLLYLYNKKAGKPTIPVSITLDETSRILVISGPNAGGKTVTMKTVGLNQMMVQSGLLVPVHPGSQMGIFKQLFIHIGDTQSLEFELSTYSSHLLHMKFFIEHANGKTLFFIDELGSGSDPNLGGSFAEVIMEELAHRKSFGIVTTHYLNLKVMANHTPGIINGAMAFDEQTLQPLYRLAVGKPGSSYTFAIAERIGLPQHLINRARKLVEEDHFRLDKLLNRTEQDLQKLNRDQLELQKLVRENEVLKKQMEQTLNRERHSQQVELLKQQNQVTEERINYLKDMERKLKQIVLEWRKAENKDEIMEQVQRLLFRKKEQAVSNKMARKLDLKYQEVAAEITVGARVKMKKNHQVGLVKEIRGKRAIVQIGQLPMNVDISELVVVKEK